MSFVYSHPFTGLANGLNTINAAGGVGGWVELGRTTAGGGGSDIIVSSLSDKRYYMVLSSWTMSTNANSRWRFNNDTGSNYAGRVSSNGGADATVTSQTAIPYTNPGFDLTPHWNVGYIANKSANEKLWINHQMHQNTAGAGTAPGRQEQVAKWANTSSAINEIRLNSSSGTYNSGSEVVVLGWDPADTHTNNFWEELDSVTLDGDNDNLTSNTFTAKKYLWVQAFFNWNGTASDLRLTFNGDDAASNANYADRRSGNGAADSTGTSKDYINLNFGTASLNGFCNLFIINNSANEKLCIYHTIMTSTAGAGTAPEKRTEGVAKWDTTGSQITDIDIYTEVAASTFQSGTTLKVWGAD